LWIFITGLSDAQLKGILRYKPENASLLKRPSADVIKPSSAIDGFGYMLISNQDGEAVDFNYVDISSTGTNVGAGDDWCSGFSGGIFYQLGFSMPFYTTTVDSISICSNGTVVLENVGRYVGISNGPLPDTTYGPTGFVAVMWDDLDPSDASAGGVYFQSFSSCPDGYPGACAIVQYNRVPRYGGSTYMDFEVIFYDNGNIKLLYNSAVDYRDATIGVQDSTAATGENPDWYLQYVYNGIPSNHVPDSGTAVLIRRIPIQSGDALVMDVDPDEYIPVAPVSVSAKIFNADTLILSSFALHLDIYDTVSNTLVFSDDQTVDLAPRTITTVTFNSFTPEERSYYMAVVYVTDTRDPDATYDTASTVFRTHVRVGDVLDTFSLLIPPLLGYNFSFITYNDLRGRFFISDMYGAVYSFDPKNPASSFRSEVWAYAPIYDPYVNYPFSIANDGDSTFFLTHLEYDGWYVYNQHLAFYSEISPGIFAWTGDTMNLWAFVPGALIYGIDWDDNTNTLWAMSTDGTNHTLVNLNVQSPGIEGTIPVSGTVDVPTGLTLLDYTGEFLITDGAQVYRVDTSGNIVDAYYTPGHVPLFDLAFYPGCAAGSTEPVVAYAVGGDSANTVLVIGTGYYCDQVISVAEKPKSTEGTVSILVNGRTVKVEGVDGSAHVYDIAGRRIASFRTSEPYTFSRTGVFFIKTDRKVFKVVVR